MIALLIVSILLTLTLGGCLSNPQILLEGGFEGGMGKWQVGTDLPIDPNTGEEVQASATISNERSRGGAISLNMTIDGRQDDGTIWIQMPLSVGRIGKVDLEVNFWIHSEWESFNLIAHVVGFMGDNEPVGESSFLRLGSANPARGWNQFGLSGDVETLDGEVWVAMGISVAWETWMTYFIDDVLVNVR
jgi:hypothetical protein